MRTVGSKSNHVLQLDAASGWIRKDSFALVISPGGSLLGQLKAQGLHVGGLVGRV